MTSQLLNWYEEGTWTPVLTDLTNNATMDAGSTGAYVRIGRQVTCVGTVNTTSLGSVTGDVYVKGLPFTNSSYNSAAAIGATQQLNIASGQSVTGRITGGQTVIGLYLQDSASGATTLQASEWSSDGYINMSITYFV